MTRDAVIFHALVDYAACTYPKFAVRSKQSSMLMRLLGKLLFFNPLFLHKYATTLGSVVYFPDEILATYPWRSLAHELVHIHDRSKSTFGPLGFDMWYLFPQVPCAVLSLVGAVGVGLAISSWGWLLLIGLVALAPFPAPGRTRLERRGYAMSIAMHYWQNGTADLYQQGAIAAKFEGPDYYWMWPFKNSTKRWIVAVNKELRSMNLPQSYGAPFPEILEVLDKNGVVHYA